MFKFIFLFIFSVLISSISQIMLKVSSSVKHEHILQEYFNPRVIIAYSLFFLSSLITVIAYKYVPLSMGPILESSGYIFVAILGHFVLKEKLKKRKLLGLGCILVGMVIYSI